MTNFVCSGMQRVRKRFGNPDGSRYGSLQSCIRTNDLELVGDGSHLTYFEMLGNFSFGGNNYDVSVELWDVILRDLRIPADRVTVHPEREDHRRLWESKGYNVVPDESCVWTDGEIGGNCCEIFVGDLEVGNLVNPLGHSTDVGFGWERMCQIAEGKRRVDETSLFRTDVDYVVRDHLRTLEVMRENGVRPGPKGREYVCKRIVRRILDRVGDAKTGFEDWIDSERNLRGQRLRVGRRRWRKFKDRSVEFWWETYGILPEEIPLIRGEPVGP